MSAYAKLFSSIVHSTIWREANHVRIVWITMLALKDRDGVVEASVPGLADAARVTLSECKAALLLLSSPDEYSRTPDNEGRRIAEVPGGWSILNHDVYRERDSFDHRRASDAERARRYRERMAATEIPPSRDGVESVTETRDENSDNRDASRLVTARHTESRLVTASDTDQIQIKSEEIPLSPPGGKRTRAKRTAEGRTLCPGRDDFTPGKSTIAMAARLSVDIWEHFDAMRDWSLSKDRRNKDWDATLRNFMRGSPDKFKIQIHPSTAKDKPFPGQIKADGQVFHRDGYWYHPLPNQPKAAE